MKASAVRSGCGGKVDARNWSPSSRFLENLRERLGSFGLNCTRIRRAGSNSGGMPKRTGNEEGKVSAKLLIFWASGISAGRTAWDDLQFGARRFANACGQSFDAS